MVQTPYNILSLFDGMSCGQIALHELGIEYGKYYASEINKHAIRQTQLNFPDTVQLGDIEGWREWSIDWASIDLVLAGTPCTGFSFAGKGLAFDDPESRLIFDFIDILNHVKSANPKVRFLLENVRMKKWCVRIISEMLGIYPVLINSALVGFRPRTKAVLLEQYPDETGRAVRGTAHGHPAAGGQGDITARYTR